MLKGPRGWFAVRSTALVVTTTLALLAPAGCGDDDHNEGDPTIDGGVDAATPCWAATNFQPCVDDEVSTQDLVINLDAVLDTDDGTLTIGGIEGPALTSVLLPQGPEAGGADGLRAIRLVSLGSLTIEEGNALRVTGSRPLLLAVHGDVTLAGYVDAVAGMSTAGPGGDDPAACALGQGGAGANSGDVTKGGGGGGGGGFGAAGGAGGSSGTGAGSTAGGSAGAASTEADLSPLRGGCAGGKGGNGGSGTLGGAGGPGGGAVQISAKGTLTVSGTIGAGGGAGFGGSAGSHAAGGGGSGGAIFLEATTLTLGPTALLCANGGSGGEGGDVTMAGNIGQQGFCSATETAFTGDSPSAGGTGGSGGYVVSPPGGAGGNASSTANSGGGGGGAVGRIRLKATTLSVDDAATVSPTAGN